MKTATRLDEPGAPPSFVSRFSPPVASALVESFNRLTLYSYLTYRPWTPLHLTAGIAYDRLHYPDGFRSALLTPGTRTRDQVSPKAALTWDLLSAVTLRGLYAQSLGGITFDESVRLEPTQLAGFSQTYRSLISEAEAGSVIAPRNEIAGAALDFRPTPTTFAGVQSQWLRSRVEQQLGVFEGALVPPAQQSNTEERLNYRERSLGVYAGQFLGRRWSLGASYQLTESRLEWSYPAIPDGTRLMLFSGTGNDLSRTESAVLHQVGLRLGYDHPLGAFARAESRWFFQDNDGYPNALNTARPGESLDQLDIFLGWRLARRRVELLVGCLNVTDQDYRLNSLTPYSELPRERVWMGRFRWSF